MRRVLRYLLYVFAALLLTIGVLVMAFFRADIPAHEVEKRYRLPQSQFMAIGGLRVHYTDEGKGEAILLLHGTGSSLHTWQKWTDGLKERFRVLRLDLPGFGLTGPAPDRNYRIARYVEFVRDFLDRLQIRQLSLAGNSLGGQIAWHFAAAYPDRINKLILVASAGLPRRHIPMPLHLARLPIVGKLGRYLSPRFLVRNSLWEVYFDRSKVTDELIERHHTLTLREGNRQAFIDRAQQLEEGSLANLERITIPTLILWGRYDTWIPVEHAEEFHRRMPWSRVVIYDNAGHVPQEEIPEQTLADVLKFLQ